MVRTDMMHARRERNFNVRILSRDIITEILQVTTYGNVLALVNS